MSNCGKSANSKCCNLEIREIAAQTPSMFANNVTTPQVAQPLVEQAHRPTQQGWHTSPYPSKQSTWQPPRARVVTSTETPLSGPTETPLEGPVEPPSHAPMFPSNSHNTTYATEGGPLPPQAGDTHIAPTLAGPKSVNKTVARWIRKVDNRCQAKWLRRERRYP